MAAQPSHDELLWAAFSKRSRSGELRFEGLKFIFEELGLQGSQQSEVLSGVWKAMAPCGGVVGWEGFRDVMLNITNPGTPSVAGSRQLTMSPHRDNVSPKRPAAFISPIDLPDDDIEAAVSHTRRASHLPSIAPPNIAVTPSFAFGSSRASSPYSFVDRDAEAQDRAGALLMETIGRYQTRSVSSTVSSDISAVSDALNKRRVELEAVEAGITAREQASILSRTRASFRAHENDQRMAITDLELSARADIVLRAWRLASIRLADVVDREKRSTPHSAPPASPRIVEQQPSAFIKLQQDHLAALQKDLDTRAAAVSQAETHVAARQREVELQEYTLRKKATALPQRSASPNLELEAKLQAHEVRLRRREEEVEAAMAKVKNLEQALAEKELNLEGIRDRQARYEERLLTREKQMEETHWGFQEEVSGRLAEISKAEADIKERVSRVKQVEKDRARLDEKMRWAAEKEEELNLLDHELRNRRQMVESNERLQTQIEGRENTLRAKEQSLSEVAKARDSAVEVREARLDEREKLLSVGMEMKDKLTQQLMEANAKLAEAHVRASTAEAQSAELAAKVRDLERNTHRLAVLDEKEKNLQIELARVASMEAAVHEKERGLDAREASSEAWVKSIAERESHAAKQVEAAGEVTAKSQRDREALLEEKAKRKEEAVSTNEFNAKLKRQEKEWLAWGDKVKAREKRVERELAKFRAAQEEFKKQAGEESQRLKEWERRLKEASAKVDLGKETIKEQKMLMERRWNDLKDQEETLKKKTFEQDREVVLRSISCTRTIGTEGPTSPVADTDADNVLQAARDLYAKTLSLQDTLDYREKQLKMREQQQQHQQHQHQQHQHQQQLVYVPAAPSRPLSPTPMPVTPKGITPLRQGYSRSEYDTLLPVEVPVEEAPEPGLPAVSKVPSDLFTQNILKGAVDVMSTLSDDTLSMPAPPSLCGDSTFHCSASNAGRRGSSVASWLSGAPSSVVNEVDGRGTPVQQLSVAGSEGWFNTSLDIAFGTPGSAPRVGRKAVSNGRVAMKGAPLSDTQLALNKITTDMTTLGSSLSQPRVQPCRSPSPRCPSITSSPARLAVDLVKRSVRDRLGKK